MSRRPLLRAPAPAREFPEEPQSAKHLKASQSVLDFARKAEQRIDRRRKRGFRVSQKTIAIVLEDSARRAQSGDWAGATGLHLVGLYAHLHAGVYGVHATELDAQGWAFAAAAAKRMTDRQFGGEIERAVEFLRWVWRREEDREKWRRSNGREGGRIGWRLQFCASGLVDDYRVDQARRK
jgi:hypothetical protein